MTDNQEIDDSLYSRQRYVLGDDAMKKMAASSVFLYGLGCIGIEIAKNLVLAGIKKLVVQDTKHCCAADVTTQFFVRHNDVESQKTRVEASLPRLRELNPYVQVNSLPGNIDSTHNTKMLDEFQCVILTECKIRTYGVVDDYCRKRNIPFIMCDVYGVLGSIFCDFGPEFAIFDVNGEDPVDVFIGGITNSNPAVVSTLEDALHGLETGDCVVMKEVHGMTEVNGITCSVKVISPKKFSIDIDSTYYNEYSHGGMATQVKQPVVKSYQSFVDQSYKPDVVIPDIAKCMFGLDFHLAYLTAKRFLNVYDRMPTDSQSDMKLFLNLSKDIKKGLKITELQPNFLEKLCGTLSGCLPPLCAFFGGVAAQEGLKALTGKFSPLQQWMYLDCLELAPDPDITPKLEVKGDGYDTLRRCIGTQNFERLRKLRIFMVGCGAIGCELLKNLALLGVATDSSPNKAPYSSYSHGCQFSWPNCMQRWEGPGCVTITDNDLIEKSNLNRQFLFRSHHIRKPKSDTAAKVVLEISPTMNIASHQHKVSSTTEKNFFNDNFFQQQDICLNALDNVEARRYMDQRCVTNCRPLIDSGTLGTKGHVQVVVPRITEIYSNHRDPPERKVAYCTLKSFPATIEHCIEWGRDKFESQFSLRPLVFRKFWEECNYDVQVVLDKIEGGCPPSDLYTMVRFLKYKPHSWTQCVQLARLKFEKHFSHKPLALLKAFPLDTKLEDGSPFWQSPKRPPVPLVFNPKDSSHMLYIRSCAQLFANLVGLQFSEEDLRTESLLKHLENYAPPSFVPSDKKIITDEKVEKRDEPEVTTDDYDKIVELIKDIASKAECKSILTQCEPLNFEKDDDSNGHIDYITAASNLRARVYNLEESSRLHIKKIAGKIVPAIATTTASVAGLVILEMLKIVDIDNHSIDTLRNAFFNLALPIFLLSSPGPSINTQVTELLSYSVWDRWEVRGHKNFTLQEFINALKDHCSLNATMIVQGSKMIYIPMVPSHSKRLSQKMISLLKLSGDDTYVDLVVSYENEKKLSAESEENAEEDDIPGPPVRYYVYG